MFQFKGFQVSDYARASLTDGLVLAHDTGMGKSIASITWPLLKVGVDWEVSRAKRGLYPKGRVLVVAPESLHLQMQNEWRTKFGITVTKLDCQDTYHKLSPLAPGWYVTSFTQLASNKVLDMPDPNELELFDQPSQEQMDQLAKLMLFYSVNIDDAKAYKPKPSSLTEDQKEVIKKAIHAGDADPFDALPAMPLANRALEVCKQRHAEFTVGLDEKKNGFRCIYSPRLSDLCHRDFDCVVIDEANKIKGEETAVGIGCRIMDPKYRLVLTATPIKNRLPDIFWLVWWATGGKEDAHARWPYSSQTGESDKFASEFLTTERNLTAEHLKSVEQGKPKTIEGLRKTKKRGKTTADVCNLHRLWKLLAPNVLRRRKADIGEYLVPKIETPIRVPMGELQAKTYEYHLSAPYLDKNDQPAVLAQLQALRSCAAAPNSPLLRPVDGTTMRDHKSGQIVSNAHRFHRSESDYTPAVAAALSLVERAMSRREQIIIGSSINEPLDAISRRLTQAGIPHDVADGRKSAAARAVMADTFKRGLPHGNPVLLCGVNAMAEGHSWNLCNNAVVIAPDWAWNLWEQFINRVHRLNSLKPVNIFPICTLGTIDLRLFSLKDEKGDAVELVLDGQLIEDNIAEVNLSELLRVAHSEFSSIKTIPESTLEAEWPNLRDSLKQAYVENCCGNAYYETKKPVIPVEAVKMPEPDHLPDAGKMVDMPVPEMVPAGDFEPETMMNVLRSVPRQLAWAW